MTPDKNDNSPIPGQGSQRPRAGSEHESVRSMVRILERRASEASENAAAAQHLRQVSAQHTLVAVPASPVQTQLPAEPVPGSDEKQVVQSEIQQATPAYDGGEPSPSSPSRQSVDSSRSKANLEPRQTNDAIAQEEASIGVTDHYGPDPFGLAALKNEAVSRPEIRATRGLWQRSRARKVESFYEKQNELIDELLQSADEERLHEEDQTKNGGKVKFAVNASFVVNFCLFCIQLFAAVSTGSLSLFATAADAFMDLVSSIVMLITSRLANKPNPVKYPVGRRRIETVGIILFCALMTTVAVQLIVESARALGEGERTDGHLKIVPLVCVALAIGAKFCLFCYCYVYRRYPAAHVFFIDHRNDLVVNVFGLAMSIVGERLVWYLDPVGAMCIGLLILFSWVSQAFDQVWLLVGKAASREFINKVIYVTMTHDPRISKVDTCRAYHAGERLYVEVDIVMDPEICLRDSHDVSQTLQRKLEGLADVERAFVHVDYEHDHSVHDEHKPLYERREPRTFKQMLAGLIRGD
ncbi:Metal tolerance protein 9 [Lasiodiplodia hormozganensis]|uniref:Metal tolerance protein 9 n=1 Tax=Lasiodiplodia hormozganensis TaxID=869390 RepID=A0AA39WHB4_9PEZI|nr:Metal tolerance protein 9 [Lasiodiplodia hormozganensis]